VVRGSVTTLREDGKYYTLYYLADQLGYRTIGKRILNNTYKRIKPQCVEGEGMRKQGPPSRVMLAVLGAHLGLPISILKRK
jgi:hypothetical protein